MVREVENPYQELKQLLKGKPPSKKKGHAPHEGLPSKQREGSESQDESIKDVAPLRRRAQRSPTPSKWKISPHSPHHYDIPGELPPKCTDDDHMIELLLSTSPPNKPLYRGSQAQQEEIMRQVNKLVEKGMDLENADEDEEDDDEEEQVGTSRHPGADDDNDDDQDQPGIGPSIEGTGSRHSQPPASQPEPPSQATQENELEHQGATGNIGGNQLQLLEKVTMGKKTQAACEDQILRLLATAEGPLLDNLDLIQTLDVSKETYETVKQSLEVAEVTARSIEVASAAYKSSHRSHVPVFSGSIHGAFPHINNEISKICSRILLTSNIVTNDEWQFFLRGGSVLDRSKQPPNPAPEWISESSWDDVTELATALPTHFEGIVASLQQETGRWGTWLRTSEPENVELPGDWEDKCNELQHLILLRCFRQDRLMSATAAYVANVLGQKFVEPPMLDLAESFSDFSPSSPLLFMLSAGVDPTTSLQQFAASRGLADGFHAVALGQGQGPIAIKLIQESARSGGWVFLANCHLMTSWLPQLEKVIQELEKSNPHEMFRLWLSSEPNDKFPISILQRSVKVTAEPPKGLRANVLRLYTQTTDESFQKCKAQSKYQKLFFALAYFHSVLLERRKFGTLGLNIPYDFDDTDFQVSDDLLKTYLDAYEETPFEALKFLISEANYGGRVTDEIDRECCPPI
ncbi:hypothetical protein L7F22_055054 [Adiantum nelumboides]|nr:hypothetical protein [Adiantum nelumboides]